MYRKISEHQYFWGIAIVQLLLFLLILHYLSNAYRATQTFQFCLVNTELCKAFPIDNKTPGVLLSKFHFGFILSYQGR